MPTPATILEGKILDRSARIGIIGLGYVGLPEAVMFANAGFPVTGFDLDPVRVDKVNAGDSYIADVPSAVLAPLVSAGLLRATLMPSGSSPAASRHLPAASSPAPPNLSHPARCPLPAASSLLQGWPPPPASTDSTASSLSSADRTAERSVLEPPNRRTAEPPNDSSTRPLPPASSSMSPSLSAPASCQPPAASSFLQGFPPPAARCPLPAASSFLQGFPLPAASFALQDCLCICVPTPLRKTRDPDISFIVGAVQGFQGHLRPGHLVILESTTYPGTTEEVVQPMLEAGGLKAGSDFHLAFSPERVNPGDPLHPPSSIPKVVGGLTPTCTHLTRLLYEQVVTKVLSVSSPRAAEMVKLLENTFRSVNIGLVNELALMCHKFDLDVWEIIDAAASKPFGFMPFYPGPGLGGHCIPVDPFYLSWKARSNGFEARFIELAGQVNGYMPHHVVSRVADALNGQRKSINGSRILVLGVAYKPNVADTRESPALEIIHLLQGRGAEISYHDPHVPELAVEGLWLKSCDLQPSRLSSQDCVVIVTDHIEVDYTMVAQASPLIVDTRNATKHVSFGREKIVRL
jgi:UDP-N-acetyl-D-glucosamine dehydrogenase